jgi:Rieske Fe-S protein
MADISRRKFLKVAAWAATVTGFSAVAIPIIAYFYPKELEEVPSEPVPVGSPQDLPDGAAKVVAYGRYPALVINTGGTLRAYSSVCTHFACLVKWNPDTRTIDCPCHEGYFNAEDGSVISGPPPRGLDPIAVRVAEDGLIYIGGEEA